MLSTRRADTDLNFPDGPECFPTIQSGYVLLHMRNVRSLTSGNRVATIFPEVDQHAPEKGMLLDDNDLYDVSAQLSSSEASSDSES